MDNRSDDQAPKYRHYMRQWREKRGLTQEQMAKELNTHRGMVSRYESGGRGLTMAMQFRIMRVLDITPAQFFQHPDKASIDVLLDAAKPGKRKEILRVLKALGLDLD